MEKVKPSVMRKTRVEAGGWFAKTRKRLGSVSEFSSWWSFVFRFKAHTDEILASFLAGKHVFSPMRQRSNCDMVTRVWDYLDKLMVRLLMKKISPTFKHIISPSCIHLSGPNTVKSATKRIKAAFETEQFTYFMRLDIKSFYNSIDHKILLGQLHQHYDDPIVLKYLEDVITVPIDKDGVLYSPTKGIASRSSLSPFFAALYLSPLDQAFGNREGVFYLRYVDDVVIFFKSKNQFLKARKRINKILGRLRLQLSPSKSTGGSLDKVFHFLGAEFALSQNLANEIHVSEVSAHSRTIRRALDRALALQTDAASPTYIQRYLLRWAAWWHPVLAQGMFDLISILDERIRHLSAIMAYKSRLPMATPKVKREAILLARLEILASDLLPWIKPLPGTSYSVA